MNEIIKEIIQLTGDLIRFKSIHSEPGEINRCADFIQRWFRAHDVPATRIDEGGIPSVMVLPPKGRAPVLLMSHIDVVDGPDDLFLPREKDGRLYGRGSVDDKYAAALSMVLVREHLNRIGAGGVRDLPFGVLITGDEEVGGAKGAKTAFQRIETRFCMALDGGNPRNIVVKEKGVLRVRLIGKGKSAHGARPWLGENAIEALMEDYRKVRELFSESTPDHWHRTVNLGKISGGTSINQVPDRAEAVLDIRYTEHDRPADLVAEMRGRIQGDLLLESEEPLFIGGESPYHDLLLEVAEGATAGFEHGASDARHLTQKGVPGVVWGADGEMSQHTADEHVVIDSVRVLYELVDRFLTRSREVG